ncbi:hypothetical protein GOA90_25195 [Sinorhizobium meliloti]|nr:hypothetical protein [Sinorhizobium meliloti]
MTSVVSICNLALSNIGGANISALTEASTEAKACNQFYEHVRDTLLQAYPWRFAGKTQALAQLTNDKAGSWAYAYSRPNDCLKIIDLQSAVEVTGNTVGVDLVAPTAFGYPYEVENGKIYCDLSPAYLRFTVRLTDPTKFPPLFVEALSWSLSARLAMPVTRDIAKRNDALQVANMSIGQAQMADANEVRETSDHDSEFQTGRA